MKWIIRAFCVAVLAVLLLGYHEQRAYIAQRSVSLASFEAGGATTDGGSWWDKFRENIRFLLWGPPRPNKWLNASDEA